MRESKKKVTRKKERQNKENEKKYWGIKSYWYSKVYERDVNVYGRRMKKKQSKEKSVNM